MPGYSDPGFDTLALHAGAALFNLERAGHVYSRISNPTNAVLEQRVMMLDDGHSLMTEAPDGVLFAIRNFLRP